ncbi:MAG: MBL fold metallo-hydrolase [Bacteroidota bacterium]
MERRITFVNHATLLIEIDGASILTDPIYGLMVSPVVPRLRRPGIPFDDLPPIDLILISHNHYDHLHLRTLRRLARRNPSTIILPAGDTKYGRRAGFQDIAETQWWESVERKGARITAVPAKHLAGRFPWGRNRSICNGYVVEAGDTALYYAGDTGYSETFKEIGKRFELDGALLPIGAYKPYDWFREIHLNPRTAVQAFLDLQAKFLVPYHWGTFKISDEPMSEPPAFLKQEAERSGISDRVHILKNGEFFAW